MLYEILTSQLFFLIFHFISYIYFSLMAIECDASHWLLTIECLYHLLTILFTAFVWMFYDSYQMYSCVEVILCPLTVLSFMSVLQMQFIWEFVEEFCLWEKIQLLILFLFNDCVFFCSCNSLWKIFAWSLIQYLLNCWFILNVFCLKMKTLK